MHSEWGASGQRAKATVLLHAISKRGLEIARVTDNVTLQGIRGARKKGKTGGLFLVPSHALCFVRVANQNKATVQNVSSFT